MTTTDKDFVVKNGLVVQGAQGTIDGSVIVTEAALNTSLGDYVALTEKGSPDGVAELDANSNVLTATGIVFEGSTADSYEITLDVIDPTADRTITLPNISGTVITTGNSNDVYPSQSGQNGKYLKTNGTTVEWASVSGGGSLETLTIGTGLSGTSYNGTSAVTIAIDSSIVTTSNTQTLTNKTLTSPVISTITNTGTLTLPTSTDTLVGRATTDTLTNKTISATNNTISISSSNVTDFNEAAQDAVGNALGSGLSYNDTFGSISIDSTVVTTSGSQTLTNKTLTTPVISSITNTGTLTLPTSTDTLVGRATTDTLTNKTINLTNNTLSGTIAEFNSALSDGDFATLAGTETLTNKTFTDSTTTFQDNTDNTKKMQFELSGITTSTTRTLTVPNVNGTIITTGDSGTVTSTMIADGTIVNNDISASAAIAVSKLSASTISGITLGNNLNTLTIGSGLSGTSYNGSSAVTVAIDSTVATTSGSQTLTNKTLTDSTTFFQDEIDNTKKMQLQLSAITTATTRTLAVPNVNGTIVTTGDTGTVTNTMLAGSIANNKLTNSTISGISLGSNLNTLTIGTGLSGTSYNGSSAVTVAIDSTVATTSGSQTLTNKTIALGNNTISGTTAQFNSALTDGDFATLSGTETLTNKTLGSTTALGANLNAATFKITSLGTPTASTDAATKQYVDDLAQGLHVHASTVTATTSNLTAIYANGSSGVGATLTNNGTQTALVIDGVTLATNDRVLVKNQSTQLQNGIYTVTNTGSTSTNWVMTRSTDMDETVEVDGGDFVFVTGGTVNDNTGWVQTETNVVVGTNNIIFTQFSGAGTYLAGNGLTLTGNTFTINTGITADLSTAQTLTNKTINGANNTLTVRLANDISGFGTGIATALAVNTGSAGAPVLFNGALGTPSSGTLTNLTGLPVTSGISGLGTGVATALGVNTGTAGSVVINGGALGTPSSGTLTNATGLPVTGITASTTAALGVGSIELGHATDTTIARSSAGVISVEGVVVPTISSTNTFTNKSLSTTTTYFTDATDATKRLNITTSGNTTAITGTLATTFTTAKTLTLPDATDTLVGRNTTDTLTNKTLTSPVISTITNTGTLTLPTSTDTLVGRATTDTLTNKTLTSPSVNTSLTTASTSFDLLNTTATTINLGGAATTLTIGATSGTTNVRNDMNLSSGKKYKINSVDISTALPALTWGEVKNGKSGLVIS